MYRVLIVDDDNTCSRVAKVCLMKMNYQVMAVTCALQALSILAEKGDNGEKTTYDIVLADVHMPVMDGFELVGHIHREFNIPVVLISSDHRIETMRKGLEIGAPAYYLKPIKANDIKEMWQFIELWKNPEIHARRPSAPASIPKTISSSSTENKQRETKTRNAAFKWTSKLHTRFVEVMLILGSASTVPKNILNLINVPSLTREQVGSHLQKFRKFIDKILDGEITLEGSSKKWIDHEYYSSIVGGNPNRIIIQHHFEQRITGIWPAPIPASLPLPPINAAETSSRGSRNIPILISNNRTSTARNAATSRLGHGNVTSQSATNLVPIPTQHIGTSNFPSLVNEFGSGQIDPSIGSSSVFANEFGNVGVNFIPTAEREDWGDLRCGTISFSQRPQGE